MHSQQNIKISLYDHVLSNHYTERTIIRNLGFTFTLLHDTVIIIIIINERTVRCRVTFPWKD